MATWIVYANTTREILAICGDVASATALVDVGPGVTAIGPTSSPAELAAQPGQFYHIGGVISWDPPLTDLEILKQRARQVHAHLRHLSHELTSESDAHPTLEVTKVHDYIARVHPSLFELIKEDVLIRTHAQLTTFCDALLLGPQDGSGNALSIPALFAAIASAPAVGVDQGVVYASPTTDAHLSIVDSLATLTRATYGLGSATSPMVVTEQELSNGNWINTIT